MQVVYELANIKEEEKLEKIKDYFETEINNLIKEITLFQTSTKRDNDSIQIHKKIFNFLLIKTKQNTLNSLNNFSDVKDENVLGISSEREIYAILDNVLPKSGLPPFISLSAQDKVAQLTDLCNIVMGIRLLNGEIGKGGIGLLTLSTLRKKLSSNLLNEVKEYCTKISDTCDKYTNIYENVDISLIVDPKELKILRNLKNNIVFFRQVITYLTMLMESLHEASIDVDNLSINYDKEIKYLIEIVEKKSAISKDQAYPRFENLSKMYSKFQEHSFNLDIKENIFHKLRLFLENSEISEDYDESTLGRFKDYLYSSDYKNDEQNFSFESGIYQNGVTILYPHTTADFLDIKLEFQGFCIVTLLKSDGLLVNGRPNIVAKYKDNYMVFGSNGAFQDFLDNPDYYFTEIISYVKNNSYLINLLNMTEQFPIANLYHLFRDKESTTYKYKSSSIMVDKVIQTPVHFYEEGLIVENYVWNEWELKRQALQLADIMKKKTVSSQTYLSHFRRENETQVYPPKDQTTNTTVSKGTNLSVPKSYVTGLRKNESKY